jgi:hypothetical protein
VLLRSGLVVVVTGRVRQVGVSDPVASLFERISWLRREVDEIGSDLLIAQLLGR